jgi:hypothetical protein
LVLLLYYFCDGIVASVVQPAYFLKARKYFLKDSVIMLGFLFLFFFV